MAETTTPKARAPRSDRGTTRPNPAAKLAELVMYVSVSIDVLAAIVTLSLIHI